MNGSRGPLPKPVALKLLEGNAGKRALNLAEGINPRVEVPTVPKHLGKEARKEWTRITPLLDELGLISGLDRAALALYCQAVGRLSELEMAFNGMVNRLMDAASHTASDLPTPLPDDDAPDAPAVPDAPDTPGATDAAVAKDRRPALSYPDAVYAASYSVTPSGYAQQSVIVQLIKSHREQVNRYLMHFGLSPAARGRVQASNYVQPNLPGIDAAPNMPQGFARFAARPELVQ